MSNISIENKIDYFFNLRTNNSFSSNFDRKFMPKNEEEAYAIQKKVTDKLGKKVLGWKLGGTNIKTQTNFNCTSAYFGPIFSISEQTPAFFDYDAPRGEAELSFRLNDNISNLNLNDINHNPFMYFDMVLPSLELPFSKINNFSEVGMFPLIADLCGTGHLVLGKGSNFDLSIAQSHIKISIQDKGKELASGSSKNIIGGVRTVLSDFLKLAIKYELELISGQFVATGGATDCIFIPRERDINIVFEKIGSLSVFYK